MKANTFVYVAIGGYILTTNAVLELTK